MASQATLFKVQEIYIGLLGRAADLEGLNYWADEIDSGKITIEQVRANIVNEQPEYLVGLGSSATRSILVTKLYNNLFNRDPEPEGLDYWVNGGGKGVNADQLVLALSNGASVTDRLALDNRADVANSYTNSSLTFNTVEASFVLADVTSSLATVVAAKAAIQAGNIVTGATFTLTKISADFFG
jgi:hypothetical protein